MRCLLIAATSTEIAPFLKHYRTTNKTLYIDFELDILITGVGIMATTNALTKLLCHNTPDAIINVGIAGAFNKKFDLGTAVAIKKDIVADMGVWEKNTWVDMFDLKMVKPNTAPYKNKGLTNQNKELLERSKLPLANAITVNQISTNKKLIDAFIEKYKPDVETMEGAAIHYVAQQFNVPYLQIRGISNYIGERNKTKWQIKAAIQNSNQVLIRLLESL
jgi:futalosine hydrolase